MNAAAFRRHADDVVERELRRAQGRLAALPRDRREEVEQVALRVAAALVDGVLEQARDEPRLAQALCRIYHGAAHEPGTRISAWPVEAVRRA